MKTSSKKSETAWRREVAHVEKFCVVCISMVQSSRSSSKLSQTVDSAALHPGYKLYAAFAFSAVKLFLVPISEAAMNRVPTL